MRRPEGGQEPGDAGLVGPSVETGFYSGAVDRQQGFSVGNLHFKVTLAAVWK